MRRLPGPTTSVIRLLRTGLLVFLLPLGVAVSLPPVIASGEFRGQTELMADTEAIVVSGIASFAGTDEDQVQIRHVIAPGETFGEILTARGLSSVEIRSWEQAAAGVYELDALQPRHALRLTFARDQGRLRACEYEIDKYAMLSMRLVHGQIQARLKAMPRLAAVRGVAVRVDATLATSAEAAGVPTQMVSELADVFGWEIDLQADVRPGDEFRLLYAELRDEEGGVRPGDILAAEITSAGRRLTAIRFENEKGESEYYDPDGRALGRRFLKYPLDFTKISSRFSGSRLHPVLKRRRPHLGVDFAAPPGTPVRAVASGVVSFARYNGEYGNQVQIEHDGVYASSYSHLQRMARGVRLGMPVAKGQVIGYVGRSGMATGPHLHFMLFRNGVYVNPLTVKLPTDEQLSGTPRIRFTALRGELLERLAALGHGIDVPALSAARRTLGDMLRPSAASYVR